MFKLKTLYAAALDAVLVGNDNLRLRKGGNPWEKQVFDAEHLRVVDRRREDTMTMTVPFGHGHLAVYLKGGDKVGWCMVKNLSTGKCMSVRWFEDAASAERVALAAMKMVVTGEYQNLPDLS